MISPLSTAPFFKEALTIFPHPGGSLGSTICPLSAKPTQIQVPLVSSLPARQVMLSQHSQRRFCSLFLTQMFTAMSLLPPLWAAPLQDFKHQSCHPLSLDLSKQTGCITSTCLQGHASPSITFPPLPAEAKVTQPWISVLTCLTFSPPLARAQFPPTLLLSMSYIAERQTS